MKKSNIEVSNSNKYVSNREFVCGLVEVIDSRIKLSLNNEFLVITELGIDGIIPLDSGDEAASIDKMNAAAEYFAELTENLRQAAQFYKSKCPETDKPVEEQAKTRNQHQQSEHLEKIHTILESLPEEEKTLYQGFGFGERAKMYKLVDEETDPVKMHRIICKMIKAISEEKRPCV